MDFKNLGLFEIIDDMTNLCHDRNLKPLSTYNLIFLIFFIHNLYCIHVICHCLVKFFTLPNFYRIDSVKDFVRKKLTLKIFLINFGIGVLVHCFIGLGRIQCYVEYLTFLSNLDVMEDIWVYKFVDNISILFGFSFCCFKFLYS